MSGRAKRSRVLAVQRHRRGNALELARVVPLYWDHGGLCESLGWTSATAALLDPSRGLHFDVHAARGHARSLIEEGDHTPCRTPDCDKGRVWRHMGPSPCPDCRGLGTWRYGEVPDPRAPYLARLGQRLLDALEGQPSECQGCSGSGEQSVDVYPKVYDIAHMPDFIEANVVWHRERWNRVIESRTFDETGSHLTMRLRCSRECPDCHGSGHNMRGYLPAIERSPQLRCKLADEMRARWTADLPTDETWGTLIHEELADRAPLWYPKSTRVVPRGEHRDVPGAICTVDAVLARRRCDPDGEGEPTSLDERLWARAKAKPLREQPRWRVGEFFHAMNRGCNV